MPKMIKLGRKDDLVSVIKHIKESRERELVFELEKGSVILENSNSLKLMKKTGEVLGKKVMIFTSDPTGRLLAKKAGLLADEVEPEVKATKTDKATRPPPRGRFSDIMIRPQKTPRKPLTAKISEKSDKIFDLPDGFEGSRLEFNTRQKPKKSSNFSKFFILILVVLVVAVFGLAVLLPQANITIFARSEPVTRDFEVSVDRSVPTIKPSDLLVPGIAVSKEVSQTKNFPATGSVNSGAKAGGSITIYNNTANTLTLRQTTTTLIASNKKFFFTKDISGIRGNGASTSNIQIIAEAGGADYNLPANTKFQIVNAALGNANVYAVNPQAFSGGTSNSSTKVLSQEDIDKATDTLMASVLEEAEIDLSQSMGNKIKILDSGVKKEILAKTANKNVGDATTSFDMTLIARVSGLAFKEKDVTEVVVSKINQVLSLDKYLLNPHQPKYSASFKSVDPTFSKGVLAVHYETVAAYKVNTNNLEKILAGKTAPEINEILLSKPEVDSVDVKFWPQWLTHKAPKFNGKIKIETVLSD